MAKTFVVVAILVVAPPLVRADEPSRVLGASQPRPSILFVGTFHFADQGLDTYKPKFSFDALSEKRQKEIADLVDELARRYRPTKIALEYQAFRQARLDSIYDAERKGLRAPTANEITQIGFRLATQLGHERVYAIDARPNSFHPGLTESTFYARVAPSLARDSAKVSEWNRLYTRLYARDDSLKAVRPLRESLLYINSEDRLRLGLGHYLVGDLRYGSPDDYVGADEATGWWNRNLRIFSNLTRLVESPNDRILVLIGAGHVPILDFVARSSPEFHFVPLAEVLGKR